MVYIALQPNGERLRYEAWVVRMYVRRELTDELLKRGLDSAVRIYTDSMLEHHEIR